MKGEFVKKRVRVMKRFPVLAFDSVEEVRLLQMAISEAAGQNVIRGSEEEKKKVLEDAAHEITLLLQAYDAG